MTAPRITYAEAAQAVAHFRLACYRFILRAVTPLNLPAYKGSTFRGGFGHALKRTVCIAPERVCHTCCAPTECLYPHLFETTVEAPDTSDASVPRPFILIPPLDTYRAYAPGDLLSCDLVLIGQATIYLPQFVVALETMGRLGIGVDQGQYALTHIQDIRPHAPAYELYPGPGGTLHDPKPPISGAELTAPYHDWSPQRLTLVFCTPTRLKYQQRLRTEAPAFHIIIRRLLDRLAVFSQVYHDTPLRLDTPAWKRQAESVRLVESHVQPYDWERYSQRQQTRMKLGGIVGTATYEGHLAPFLPLLALGEWLHIGKGTTFGLGKYCLVDPAQPLPGIPSVSLRRGAFD